MLRRWFTFCVLLLLGALLLLSLTAKPTFMQAFLPAACLFFLVQWVRHPQNSRFFLRVLACVVPAIAFMILQYMYYFGIIVPSQGDMVLEISLEKLGRVLLSTLLMQAFPLYVLLFFRQDGQRDTLFYLSLIMDAVGVLEYLLLGENGRRKYNKICKGCVHPCKQSFRAVLISCPHYQSARSKKCGNRG